MNTNIYSMYVYLEYTYEELVEVSSNPTRLILFPLHFVQ